MVWSEVRSIGVVSIVLAALAQPVLGVGLLQSLDIEIWQGGNDLLSASGVNTDATPLRDGSTPIYLGTAANGTEVWATVAVDKPAVADEPDRNFHIQLNGTATDVWGSGQSSIFNTLDTGDVEIRLTNMTFSGVDAIHRVEPFSPDDYASMPGLPFYYMLNHGQGFLNLPGAIQYTPPNYPESVQVPKDVWTSEGYGFAKLNSGWNTGFELTSIADLTAWTMTPVDPVPGAPYFGPIESQIVPGWIDEVGIAMNMRDVLIPEPSTALLILGLMAAPLSLRGRRARS
jgi:hypothetical protein